MLQLVSFQGARDCVIQKVKKHSQHPKVETVELEQANNRILAVEIRADRDYPPLDRSVRDGFAVRSTDLPGKLHVIGEVRAGDRFQGRINPGEAVAIMTGAPIPEGADAVVMVEHCTVEAGSMRTERAAAPGHFINPKGAEAKSGDILLSPGKRIDFTDLALLATAGCAEVQVYARPKVSILATGDEIVPVAETPLDHQIRNSNVYALAAQVERAGGIPEVLGVAPDEFEQTRGLIDRGLMSDMLLISGGVSAGKYDLVENVLADFGAEFYFDRVAIQPGQPLVFGRARERFFFGLPGNPASTMVTFELFGRAAVELLSGKSDSALPFALARLTAPYRHKAGLTRILPATVTGFGELTPIPWKGSSDVPAMSRANAFMIVDADRETWAAGDLMPVLMKA